MPPAFNQDAGQVGEVRTPPVAFLRAVGEGGEHVELGDGAGDAEQGGDMGLQRLEYFLEQGFFPRQAALAGR